MQYGAYALVRSATRRRRETSLYYVMQSRILWVLAVFWSPYLIAHVLIRYHLVPVLARRPILFFRAFRSPAAPLVFSAIVAKAARRVGIVHGLVHALQPSSTLQTNLDLAEQGHFEMIDDDKWQSWVVERLKHASAVVVDVADNTENLRWEIERAIETLGPSRVVLLAARGTSTPFPQGLWRFEYTLDREGVKTAQRQLQTWLRANARPGHDYVA